MNIQTTTGFQYPHTFQKHLPPVIEVFKYVQHLDLIDRPIVPRIRELVQVVYNVRIANVEGVDIDVPVELVEPTTQIQ